MSKLTRNEPTDEHLLGEVDDLLRNHPDVRPDPSLSDVDEDELLRRLDDYVPWVGRAVAILEAWDFTKLGAIRNAQNEMLMNAAWRNWDGYVQMRALLLAARANLRLRLGQVATHVQKGAVHDYFDEVRKLVESAQSAVFFVDPYLDADFVTSYLPYIPRGVKTRLLSHERQRSRLTPAVNLFRQQEQLDIDTRFCSELHDRFLFVDNAGYLSGASFKDGGKNAPALVAPLNDALGPTRTAYEALWQGASS